MGYTTEVVGPEEGMVLRVPVPLPLPAPRPSTLFLPHGNKRRPCGAMVGAAWHRRRPLFLCPPVLSEASDEPSRNGELWLAGGVHSTPLTLASTSSQRTLNPQSPVRCSARVQTPTTAARTAAVAAAAGGRRAGDGLTTSTTSCRSGRTKQRTKLSHNPDACTSPASKDFG